MTHDIKELDDPQASINRIEQQILLAQMELAGTVLVSSQRVILPLLAQNKERPIVADSKEVDGFLRGFQDAFSASSSILFHCLSKSLRGDDAIAHRSSISSKSCFDEAYPFTFPLR